MSLLRFVLFFGGFIAEWSVDQHYWKLIMPEPRIEPADWELWWTDSAGYGDRT